MTTTLHVVTEAPGPGWEPGVDRREQAGWDAHAAFMDGLVARGVVILAGPLGEGTEVLLVVRAGSVEDVRSAFADDPWLQTAEPVLELAAIRPWEIWLDGVSLG
jgi:uncharacterized protein YciI